MYFINTPLHFLYIKYSMIVTPTTPMSITMTTITIMIGVDELLSSDWLVGCCFDMHVIPSIDSHTSEIHNQCEILVKYIINVKY